MQQHWDKLEGGEGEGGREGGGGGGGGGGGSIHSADPV